MTTHAALWRFIEPGENKGFYEEHIFQHLITEHRAIRRTFGERVCSDPAAMAEVTDQVRRAAVCTPPTLPMVYCAEQSEEGFHVYMELVIGRPLLDMIRASSFRTTKAWCNQGLRLVDALLDLREAGVRFDKVDLDQLVVTDLGTVRLVSRAPVGQPTEEAMRDSPVLQKLARQPRMGPYVGGRLNDGEEMHTAGMMLLKMAQGEGRSYEEYAAELNRSRDKGVEIGPMANLLLDLYRGPGGRAAIASLDQLRDRLLTMVVAERTREREASAPKAPAPAPPHASLATAAGALRPPRTTSMLDTSALGAAPPAPARPHLPTPDEIADNPWANAPVTGGLAAPASVAEPAPPSAAPASTPPSPAPPPIHAAPVPSTPMGLPDSESLHRPEGFPSSAAPNPDEMVNPYAEPAAAVLTARGTSSSRVAKSHSAPASMVPLGSAPPAQRTHSSRPLLIGVFGMLGIAAVGFVGFKGIGMLMPVANEPPVAVITPPATPIRVQDVVPIMASESSDPEGARLNYTWRVLDQSSENVIFTDAGERRGKRANLYLTSAPGITVQVLEQGTYRLQLVVSDSVNQSEPAELTLTVEPGRF